MVFLIGTKDPHLSDECDSSEMSKLLNLTSVSCKQCVCRNLHLYVPSEVWYMLVSSRCYLRTQPRVVVEYWSVSCKQRVCRNLHLYVPSEVWYMLVSSRCYLRTQARVVVEYWFRTSSECTLGMLHMKIWAIEGTFHLYSSPAVCCGVFDPSGW